MDVFTSVRVDGPDCNALLVKKVIMQPMVGLAKIAANLASIEFFHFASLLDLLFSLSFTCFPLASVSVRHRNLLYWEH